MKAPKPHIYLIRGRWYAATATPSLNADARTNQTLCGINQLARAMVDYWNRKRHEGNDNGTERTLIRKAID